MPSTGYWALLLCPCGGAGCNVAAGSCPPCLECSVRHQPAWHSFCLHKLFQCVSPIPETMDVKWKPRYTVKSSAHM